MEDLRRVQFRLSKPEQQQLDKLWRGGRQPVLKRKLAPRVGRETVRILLESHELKPWREKMWCVAELDEEYIARVEDVLAVYQKPLSVREPVVCIDEKPVVLHEEVGPPVAMQPGRVARRDAEPALRNGQRFLRRPTQSGAAFHQGDAQPFLARVCRLPAGHCCGLPGSRYHPSGHGQPELEHSN